jgi:hypothetical protein
MRWRWLLFLAAALALTAAGCAWPEPYVYRYQEFDRSRVDFGKEPTDLASVGICYNKKNATPERIVEMAKAECAKYGRVAVYSKQRRLECPLVTPMEAVFTCRASPAFSQWPTAPQPLPR